MFLSNNIALPTLPAIAARSTWAIVFATLITLFNALGVDLLGFFSVIGAGATPDEVIATGQKVVSAWQIVAPLALGIWAWVERRAPNFRLSFWGSSNKSNSTLSILAAAMVFALVSGLPSMSRAETPSSCFDPNMLTQSLGDRYGEELMGYGTMAEGRTAAAFANPTTGSWTVIVFTSGKACVLLVGEKWTPALQAPAGDPA